MCVNRLPPSLGLLAALLVCSGCFNPVFVASTNGYVDTKVTGEGRRFSVRVRNDFGAWGFAPHYRILEVDSKVTAALRFPVSTITGLRIIQHKTFLDGMVELLTIGLYCPRTLIIEGEIHDPVPSRPRR